MCYDNLLEAFPNAKVLVVDWRLATEIATKRDFGHASKYIAPGVLQGGVLENALLLQVGRSGFPAHDRSPREDQAFFSVCTRRLDRSERTSRNLGEPCLIDSLRILLSNWAKRYLPHFTFLCLHVSQLLGSFISQAD